MRIATYNVNSITARLPRLLAWLESSGTDVLCIQETKCTAEQFPTAALAELGYESAVNATGRWNGVALLSRVGLSDVVTGLPDGPDYDGVQEPRAISATCGPLRLWSVYVPNGREVEHEHYTYKLRWLEALRKAVAADAAKALPFAVLGDFNVAPTDEDVWDPALFAGCHACDTRRARRPHRPGGGGPERGPAPPLKYDRAYTFWDYRELRFPKNKGMRIDLTFGNAPFTAAVKDSYVDREERKGKGASDHAPVVVDLDL